MNESKKPSADQQKNQNQKNQGNLPGGSGAKKTAGNNQWVTTGLIRPESPERRDGPGGESGKN